MAKLALAEAANHLDVVALNLHLMLCENSIRVLVKVISVVKPIIDSWYGARPSTSATATAATCAATADVYHGHGHGGAATFDTTGATAIAGAHVATELLCLWGWTRR